MFPSRRVRSKPRRFFGLNGVVRRARRAADGDPPRRQRRADPSAADPFASERERFAAQLDLDLRLTCRSEATVRRELGDAARALLRGRAYAAFGFVRLADYARERLGVSGSTVQEAAWMARRLDELPAIARAYDRSELSWAQARTICKVAVAANDGHWVDIARRSTADTLDRLVARTRRPEGVPRDPDGEPNEIDGEPAVRWRLTCPARVRALWRRAAELASRAAGERLADWRAAEVIAAEGFSGRPSGAAMGDRALIESIRSASRARRRAREQVAAPTFDAASTVASASVSADAAATPPPPPGSETDEAPAPLPLTLESPATTDSFALEARVIEAMRALRSIDPKIGRLLRVVVDQRIYKCFRFRRLEDYARERLGISARKAWALLAVEKAARRSADFADAYHEGRLSWVRAVTLLPVLERTHAAAWVARAQAVTVRRLADEVAWVLAARDVAGPDVSLAPPPIDSALPSPTESLLPSIGAVMPAGCADSSPDARLQIRVHDDAATPVAERHDSSLDARLQIRAPGAAPMPTALPEMCDAEVRFTGPASVVALLRDVLDAFGDPYEPRWRALERLLRHVIGHWESLPRHPDPVFARDGWRCTVPACSSRRNLHDHHITFRSRGGDNARGNRTAVCAAHHLHGLHAGTITASGTAPHAIEWRLGVRPNAPPLLRCVGDRYVLPEPGDVASTADAPPSD
jgi:hypothetical protein